MRHKVLTAIIILILIVAFTPSRAGQDTQTSTKGPQATTVKPTPVGPVPAQIDKTISSLGFFTIITDANGKTLDSNEDGAAPYDVLVFTDNQFQDDCFGAKNALYESMKALYTNPSIKQKLARVQFTAPYQLRASLGSLDGLSMTDELWENNGPSNTWKVFQQVSQIENNTKPLNTRTYGVNINPECN